MIRSASEPTNDERATPAGRDICGGFDKDAAVIALAVLHVVAAGATFTCTPVRVWDGDGPVWCAEGPRVRLAGIAAREIDETCRPGQPCPDASGQAARDRLVDLLGGSRGKTATGHILVSARPLQCLSEGSAGGARTAAWCRTQTGSDLSCAMLGSATVLRWPRYWRNHQCP